MTRCFCQACSPDPLPTYTLDYIRLCEARTVLRMGREDRRKFYHGVQSKRGRAEMLALQARVRQEWENR